MVVLFTHGHTPYIVYARLADHDMLAYRPDRCTRRASRQNPATQCPLWVKSGRSLMIDACLLYPQKRTLLERVRMSALCQKRTSGRLRLLAAWPFSESLNSIRTYRHQSFCLELHCET